MATEILLSETAVLKRKKQAVWLMGAGLALFTIFPRIYSSFILTLPKEITPTINFCYNTMPRSTIPASLAIIFFGGGIYKLKPLLNKVVSSFFYAFIFFFIFSIFPSITESLIYPLIYPYITNFDRFFFIFENIIILEYFTQSLCLVWGCSVILRNYKIKEPLFFTLYGSILIFLFNFYGGYYFPIVGDVMGEFLIWLQSLLLLGLFFLDIKNFINSDFVGVEASQDTFEKIDKGYLSAPVIGLAVCAGLAFLCIYLINHFQPSIQ